MKRKKQNKILKDLFVPYPICVKLRDKKFNEPCIGYWNDNWDWDDTWKKATEEMRLRMPTPTPCHIVQLPIPFYNRAGEGTTSPMYTQVLDWALKKHKKILAYYPDDRKRTNKEISDWLDTIK